MKDEVQTPDPPYFAQFLRDAEIAGGIGWDPGRSGSDTGAMMMAVVTPQGQMRLVMMKVTKDAISVL